MARKTAATAPEIHETAMDYAEHERSYQLFIGAVKWSIISIAVLVIVLYFWIQP